MKTADGQGGLNWSGKSFIKVFGTWRGGWSRGDTTDINRDRSKRDFRELVTFLNKLYHARSLLGTGDYPIRFLTRFALVRRICNRSTSRTQHSNSIRDRKITKIRKLTSNKLTLINLFLYFRTRYVYSYVHTSAFFG